jgi:hypothetical protein
MESYIERPRPARRARVADVQVVRRVTLSGDELVTGPPVEHLGALRVGAL